MISPIQYIRRSLSAKLSIWIVLFALVIFFASLRYVFTKSLDTVQQEAFNRATHLLENTVLSVNSFLKKVEAATNNTESMVLYYLQNPDYMFFFSRHIVETNPFLNGCSIAFEPYYYKEKGQFFSAYAYNNNGVMETEQEGNEKYNYVLMDWYMLPKLSGMPGWTDPFIDYDPDDPSSKELISSYCKPLKDGNGRYVGTISVDVTLNEFAKIISEVKPYPHSYSIMIGQGGTFFVHPDSTKQLYETIFTETLERPDTALTALGHAMLRGEEGMRKLEIGGEDCYVFYKPIGTTGWSTAVICPEDDIFEGYNRFKHGVEAIVGIGLLLLLIIFVHIISKELKPLKRLVHQTGTIAKGHFDQTLPEVKRIDEIGQLSQSFGEMQQSLVNYIAELKETTAKNASIENELRVAADIQMSMLPRVFPPFPERKDIDLFASMTPAKEVGGDLYNFLLLDERLYYTVGDVSGKGVPASLFMAQATRLFRTLASEGYCPKDIAFHMNCGLCEGNDTMMFVTMFIGVIDLQTGQMSFCNCGHNPPMIDGQFLTVKYKNRPLGIIDGIPFNEESIPDILDKQLLVYTDGLNEAMNKDYEQLGNERLLKLMDQCQEFTACQVIEMLKEAVEAHRNGADPNDDLTLLCLRISNKGKS